MLRFSMIGFGAIGTGVLELVRHDPELQVDRVIVHAGSHDRARTWLDEHGYADTEVSEQLELGTRQPELVVECAGHSAIEEHVLPALAHGVPCMIVSVGALATPGLPERLEQAARAGGTQVQLLSGAIGAIDALAGARVGGLDRVSYRGRKPPRAWQGTAAERTVNLDAVTVPTLIFEGSAREAAARFPKNANVAATLGLAGIGMDRTQVRLYADPQVSENVHEIEAEGAFGSLSLTMRGRPLPANPKTAALTIYCVVRALGNRAHALII